MDANEGDGSISFNLQLIFTSKYFEVYGKTRIFTFYAVLDVSFCGGDLCDMTRNKCMASSPLVFCPSDDEKFNSKVGPLASFLICLLYTSDAADE